MLHSSAYRVAAEGVVQQRLLQRVERGELPLVDGCEALGFDVESQVESTICSLFGQ